MAHEEVGGETFTLIASYRGTLMCPRVVTRGCLALLDVHPRPSPLRLSPACANKKRNKAKQINQSKKNKKKIK